MDSGSARRVRPGLLAKLVQAMQGLTNQNRSDMKNQGLTKEGVLSGLVL